MTDTSAGCGNARGASVESFPIESAGSLGGDGSGANAGSRAANRQCRCLQWPRWSETLARTASTTSRSICSGRLLVVNDARKLVRSIRVPTPYVTNVAFDLHDTSGVFITGAFEQWKPPFTGVVYRWHNEP